MKEKYGFVYIWYDRKHKRFYIGCRWGNENDGYICSSKWMNKAYKRRPKDFKRKILSRIYTSKQDLLAEEYKWLSKIKLKEIGNRYYNLHNHRFNHWSTDETKKQTIGEKISQSHKDNPNWGHWSKGKTFSEEHRKKLSESRKKHSGPNKGKKLSEEHIQKLKSSHLGKEPWNKNKTNVYSEETLKIMSESKKWQKRTRNDKGQFI